jgi:signal transduction histidine kinase
MDALCRTGVATVAADARLRDIVVSYTSPHYRAIVEGDPQALSQAVLALCSNAVKFSDDQSTVDVSLTCTPSHVEVTVKDSGIGLPAAALTRIFEPFWQADPSPTRTRGGLGLGLTTARYVTALHGGSVSAYSEGTGRGAAFRMTLPRAKESPTSPVVPFGAAEDTRLNHRASG